MSHAPGPAEKRWVLAAVVFFIIAGIGLFYETQRTLVVNVLNDGFEASYTSIGPYYEVTRVVDGDTLIVDYEGKEERVRLIGIDTPESVDPRRPIQCFGKEAGERLEELAEGKLVRLELDATQGERDSYGRMLAYVYLESGEMLNRKMVAEGYAYEYTYMLPYRHQRDFRSAQTLARLSARGFWSPETCNGEE